MVLYELTVRKHDRDSHTLRRGSVVLLADLLLALTRRTVRVDNAHVSY